MCLSEGGWGVVQSLAWPDKNLNPKTLREPPHYTFSLKKVCDTRGVNQGTTSVTRMLLFFFFPSNRQKHIFFTFSSLWETCQSSLCITHTQTHTKIKLLILFVRYLKAVCSSEKLQEIPKVLSTDILTLSLKLLYWKYTICFIQLYILKTSLVKAWKKKKKAGVSPSNHIQSVNGVF